ncbi:peptidoglycan DD-metalloendopeptidase family protein [Klenkia sp. PcliD-1-E]|uniref:M23 family metallopeptidase n=1 Tax=Klenkia sp. PcliD-1-E TaxID=2954492 RepID=UPI0020985BE3|nr:peptidoglycan DD-metalloendopeptidase family protein [Klenkia sp. PcliD-1-E]MCO7222259.1 M23 family metallopeptidase [Klenkia sp. PcliD-1-E]
MVGPPRPGRPVRDRSVLEAPALDLTALEDLDALPAARFPADDALAPPAGRVEVLAGGPVARPTGRHRLPRPPRRRGGLLLAALAVGGLLAAVLGSGAAPRPDAVAGDYGLSATESNFSGGMDDADARREITAAEAQARLDDLAASRAAREPSFVLPTDGVMTTCFCQRWGQMHWGIDLAAPLGTPIVAAADGVVLRAGPASGYGNAIYVQDADGNVEIYGHMRYLYVEAGDVVSAGDLIAKVGSEGQSTGPHLHFEIHVGSMTGRPTDPEVWLNDRGISVPGA